MRANKVIILMYPWAKLPPSEEPFLWMLGLLCILLSAQTACWSPGKFKRGKIFLQPRKFMVFFCTDQDCGYFIPSSVFYCFFLLFASFFFFFLFLFFFPTTFPLTQIPPFHLCASLPSFQICSCCMLSSFLLTGGSSLSKTSPVPRAHWDQTDASDLS